MVWAAVLIDGDDRLVADGLEAILAARGESGKGDQLRKDMWCDLADGGWLAFFDGALTDHADGSPVAALLGGEALGRHLAPLSVVVGAGFVTPLMRTLPRSSALARVLSTWMTRTDAVAIPRPVVGVVHDAGGAARHGYSWTSALRIRTEGGTSFLDGTVQDMILCDAQKALVPVVSPLGGTGVAALDLRAPGVVADLSATVVDGVRCGRLHCSSVPVPDEALCLEDASDAIRTAGAVWSLLLDAYAVGVARALVARSVEYARTRTQFGRAIGEFQAVQHMAADMQIAAETSASLLLAAMRQFVAAPEGSFDLVAASRLHASASARSAAELSLQLHGGVGFTWELGLHEWYRQAMFGRHFLTDERGLRAGLASSIRARAGATRDERADQSRVLEAIPE